MQPTSNNASLLAASPAGQALLQRLKQQDAAAVEKAAQAAKAGDSRGMLQALNALLADPETARLLRSLGSGSHE